METLGNAILLNSTQRFYCKCCDYGTSKKSSFDDHILSTKHENGNVLETNGNYRKHNSAKICSNKYSCEVCDKNFKTRSGLWKHNKICNNYIIHNNETLAQKANEPSDKEIIIMVIQQNAELMKKNDELQNMMMKVIENGTHNTTNNTNTNTNTNSHNKTFNLQFFLNETCKNALNIDDFVSSIKVSLTELENTGRRGYIEGISTIIINELNKLSHCDRPIHCSDNKRETMYIKNENQWFKETEEKPILKKAIKIIANENIKQINTWRQQNPDCTEADSNKNNLYLQIVSNSMSGSTKEESDKNYEKIISNIAKQVIIDK